MGATRGTRPSTCTGTSSRPSSRALRCVGTASDAYLAKPFENQGVVNAAGAWRTTATAAPQASRGGGAIQISNAPSGVPPRKRALVVWKPPQPRCAVPLEHMPSLPLSCFSVARSTHAHMRPGDLSYSHSFRLCPVADHACSTLWQACCTGSSRQVASAASRAARGSMTGRMTGPMSYDRPYGRTYDRNDRIYDRIHDGFYDRPLWDLTPGPVSGSGPHGGARVLLSRVPCSCTSALMCHVTRNVYE